MKTIIINWPYEQDIDCKYDLHNLITGAFNDCIKYKKWIEIELSKLKYISISYIGSKSKVDWYFELWECYLRNEYTLEQLLILIMNDKYIKNNYK